MKKLIVSWVLVFTILLGGFQSTFAQETEAVPACKFNITRYSTFHQYKDRENYFYLSEVIVTLPTQTDICDWYYTITSVAASAYVTEIGEKTCKNDVPYSLTCYGQLDINSPTNNTVKLVLLTQGTSNGLVKVQDYWTGNNSYIWSFLGFAQWLPTIKT